MTDSLTLTCLLTYLLQRREKGIRYSRVATYETGAAGPAYMPPVHQYGKSTTLRIGNPINLTGEGQVEPQQPGSGGRSDSESDVDSTMGNLSFS